MIGNNPIQSLFYAGNISPSTTLKKFGRVYGFTNVDYARGWKRSKGYKNIYQFTTDKYVMDRQTYSRPMLVGTQYSDVEFVAFNVLTQRKIR